MTASKGKHKWIFPARFKTRSFGWRSSRLACQRIKEALSEIKGVARKDPVLGAEGAIKLMEKFWPALQEIDTSSGAVGTATYNAMEILLPLVINAPVSPKQRNKWLERLWRAVQEDGVEYLGQLTDRWGEVCCSPEVASEWADSLLPPLKISCSEEYRSFFKGATACLSCLLAAGRNQEILDLLDKAPYKFWHYRVYGVRALAAEGHKAEAIKYAEASQGLNDSPSLITEECEKILLSSGFQEEAYRKYAFAAVGGRAGLAAFRAIVKRYPDKDKEQILRDLIKLTPGQEGTWFATAKRLELFGLALDLVSKSPTDPLTLNRAARDYLETNPKFAFGSAMASLYWIAENQGYEISAAHVIEAFEYALAASEKYGMTESVEQEIRSIAAKDRSMDLVVKRTLGKRLGLTDV
jgi:hypothetical protein